MSDDVQNNDEKRAGGTQEPPGGVERRQLDERRKLRTSEGRERYLDMVQRERALLLDQGIARSTEQLLDLKFCFQLGKKGILYSAKKQFDTFAQLFI